MQERRPIILILQYTSCAFHTLYSSSNKVKFNTLVWICVTCTRSLESYYMNVLFQEPILTFSPIINSDLKKENNKNTFMKISVFFVIVETCAWIFHWIRRVCNAKKMDPTFFHSATLTLQRWKNIKVDCLRKAIAFSKTIKILFIEQIVSQM